MGQVAVKLPVAETTTVWAHCATPIGNRLVLGLGIQEWNSKILLTLIVAKRLPKANVD